MLPGVHHATVLELEDDAATDIEALAIPLRAIVMDADDEAVIIVEHMQQPGLESPARQAPIAPELGHDRLASHVVARHEAVPR